MTARSTPRRWSARTAWALLGLCLLLGVVQAALGSLAGQSLRELAAPTANVTAFGVFAVVGAALAARRPRLIIGWLLLVIGLSSVLESYLIQYALAAPDMGLPLAATAEWLGFVVWGPSIAGVGILLLVFPDGRMLSRRWRWALAPIAVALGLIGAAGVVAWPSRGRLSELAAGAVPVVLGDVAFVISAVAWLVGLAALVVRFRRGDDVERRQIAWLGYAAVVMVVFIAVAVTLPSELSGGGFLPLDLVAPFAPALLAVAIWVAVTRHGLYELGRVVSRTVTYTAVTVVLVAVYAGLVVVLRVALTPLLGDSDLAVAGSTLAVASLFGPLRRRVQLVVDRRFDRQRYDAARQIAAFGSRLRDEVDLDEVAAELRTAVTSTVAPAAVSLWVRPSGEVVP